jgi:hypothetical protein
MSDESSGADENLAHPWRALTICLLGGGMVLLDVSIVNVALPSIRTGLLQTGSAARGRGSASSLSRPARKRKEEPACGS